jgi:hypothetical protein
MGRSREHMDDEGYPAVPIPQAKRQPEKALDDELSLRPLNQPNNRARWMVSLFHINRASNVDTDNREPIS